MDFFLSMSITILLEENGGLVGHSFFILETWKYNNKIWERHLIFFSMLQWWVDEVKLDNPSHGTIAHSQPLASYNSCLQTVLFFAVSCQLWHQKSLAAHSCTPSSNLKLGPPIGRLPVNSAFTVFLGIWLRGSLCTCPAQCSLFNLMHNTRSRLLYFLWCSLYLILNISFSLTGPIIQLKIFLSKDFKRFFFLMTGFTATGEPYEMGNSRTDNYTNILTNSTPKGHVQKWIDECK